MYFTSVAKDNRNLIEKLEHNSTMLENIYELNVLQKQKEKSYTNNHPKKETLAPYQITGTINILYVFLFWQRILTRQAVDKNLWKII